VTPLKQCKSCPWRLGARPEHDIPGYSVEKHRRLAGTIVAGVASLSAAAQRTMACHYSPVGAERPCAGWLHNQLGVGNNIGVRLAIIAGRLPPVEVDGDQHQRFEDTLPSGGRAMTRAGALAEARQRWDRTAAALGTTWTIGDRYGIVSLRRRSVVDRCEVGYHEVLSVYENGSTRNVLPVVMGAGPTWDIAFARAALRSEDVK
jgi:hypothetical protein